MREHVLNVFIDLSEAFDCVHHLRGLPHKLVHGVPRGPAILGPVLILLLGLCDWTLC
ncbi:hypothetical protein J6590_107879, partial [Homalodisca vitripennis]